MVGGGYADGTASVNLNDLPDDINALARALLESIAGHESKGSYNAWNKGTSCSGSYLGKEPHNYAPIVQMTPAQILTRYYGRPFNNTKSGTSRAVSCSNRLFAVGKYQWIPPTLSDMIYKAPFRKYLNTPFSAQAQEEMALTYFFSMKRPSIGQFLKDGKNKEYVKHQIAKEWASIAVPKGLSKQKGVSNGCPSKNVCDTFYNKQGGNKAFYESTVKVWAILDKIESIHQKK